MNWLMSNEQAKKLVIAKVRIKNMMKRIRTLESEADKKCEPIAEQARIYRMRYEVFENLYDELKKKSESIAPNTEP